VLKPEDLNRLKAMYPDKSFIYIFQTTKEVKFKEQILFSMMWIALLKYRKRARLCSMADLIREEKFQYFSLS
jgi:hypothetical protein